MEALIPLNCTLKVVNISCPYIFTTTEKIEEHVEVIISNTNFRYLVRPSVVTLTQGGCCLRFLISIGSLADEATLRVAVKYSCLPLPLNQLFALSWWKTKALVQDQCRVYVCPPLQRNHSQSEESTCQYKNEQ